MIGAVFYPMYYTWENLMFNTYYIHFLSRINKNDYFYGMYSKKDVRNRSTKIESIRSFRTVLGIKLHLMGMTPFPFENAKCLASHGMLINKRSLYLNEKKYNQ